MRSSATAIGLAIAGAAVLAPGAGAATHRAAPHPAAPHRAAPAGCRTAQLVDTLTSANGGGYAGGVYEAIRFTNIGPACTLRGYPGVSAVDAAGRQIGAAAGRASGLRQEPTVTLRAATPDRFASTEAVLQVQDAQDYPASHCRYTIASGLRVYAPGQRAAQYVPGAFLTCARRSARVLGIYAVGARP